ncbi:type III-B CRISPR module-associated Cmr3 family protein [Caenispirillum bisanense]|uniref:type III-B CRISPR module-associated Cmr3 family protein n=1 Tax=Caenispirillum bisanense TaxID=414052 RepID=UPI0031D3B7D3
MRIRCCRTWASDDAPCLGRPDIGDAKPLDGWLNPTNLRFALEGEQVGGERRAWQTGGWARQRPCFVWLERQPGLAIDLLTGTAQADALFFTEALRFKPGSGLFCSLTGRLAPGLRAAALEQGAVSAGRKGRLACFRPAPSVHPDWLHVMDGRHLPDAVEGADERFWLLAITPAHLPDPRRPLARTSWPDGVEVVVEAALTGKLEAMGGFDITSGRPRPNRMYVPAGSAWLIRLRGGSPDSRAAVLRALHDRHPLGDPAEAAMGFGHTLVGRGPLTTEQVA